MLNSYSFVIGKSVICDECDINVLGVRYYFTFTEGVSIYCPECATKIVEQMRLDILASTPN